MIRKMLETRKNEESGFTLVELLVVILIIGILAAIAIPVFLNQRQRANDSAVESDVRNLATTIETMLISEPNTDHIDFDLSDRDLNIEVGEEDEDITLSDGVVIASVTAAGPVGNGYVINAYHTNGRQYQSGSPLEYNSAAGGFQD